MAAKTKTLWWVSWEEHDSPGDTRPLHDPPGANVIAWWCTGYSGDGRYATMVALVLAVDTDGIEEAIRADWPAKKLRVWRFCERRSEPVFFSDRFPFAPWSVERLKKLGVKFDVTEKSR